MKTEDKFCFWHHVLETLTTVIFSKHSQASIAKLDNCIMFCFTSLALKMTEAHILQANTITNKGF